MAAGGIWRKREEALELGRAFEASGLTRERFAEQAGITVAKLDDWRRRARRERGEGVPLVAVELAGPGPWAGGGALTLALDNGRRIEIGRDFEEAVLERLLAVAERRR